MNYIKLIFYKLRKIRRILLVYVPFIAVVFFSSFRYEIAPSHAASHCLHSKLFLVDRFKTKNLKRGQLVTFIQTIETKALPHATNEEWLKILVGLPGDTINITSEYVHITTPAGEVFSRELPAHRLIEALNANNQMEDVFERTIILGSNEVFLMGETEGSYDSRFWGPQTLDNITGTSYAIL